MINNALQFTSNVLNQFLKNRFGLDESKVLLNNLIDSNGAIPAANQNKIILSLINIEKETNKPFYGNHQQIANGNYVNTSPAERYNLDVLISSNFDDYNETLKFLTAVITFFQVNTFIDAGKFSNIPAGLTKLEYEIEKITYHNMQSLWTAMGAKYQPSVLYKMRLITIQANEAVSFTTAIAQTSNLVTP